MTETTGNNLPADTPYNEPLADTGKTADAASPETKKEEKKEEPRVTPGEMFQYADGTDKVLMIIGTITSFVAGAGMPAFSYVFGEMINTLVEANADVESVMAETSLIMTIVGLVVYALQFAFVACFLVTADRQTARIKSRFFASILRQDMAWHDEHKPGELTARMTGDTRVIQNGINDKVGLGFFQFGMFIFGFGFGFYYSWELTLVMFGTMPLIAVVGAMMAKVMTSMTEESRENFAKAGAIATEVMENVRTVQVFGREDFETSRFEKSVKDAEKAGIKKEFVSNASIGVTYCVLFSSYTIAFFFASYLVEWERNDVGEITATFFSVLMGSFGAGLIFPSVTAFTEALAAAHKVYAVINRVPVIDIDAGGKPVSGIETGIEFRNVRFSYPTRMDQKLFTNLSLEIPRGKKIAFSGASGCGKSSIIGLLQRFYDPQEGQVLVDGVDMKELCLREWRDQIGIVSQEPSLFSGSMADNVRTGKEDATMEEIIAACKMANIHDTIMLLPDQYDTSVGSVGSQLSGGQKQRLAIARAIIKKPRLLILDEATSALDRKSEVEVQSALDLLLESSGLNMTVVVIAHRLATIRNVDTIYYIGYDAVLGSEIAESGSFDELMEKKGQFAAMAMLQGAHKVAEVSEQNTAASPSAARNKDDGEAAGHSHDHKEDGAEGDAKKKPLMGTPEAREGVAIEKLVEWEVENTEVPAMRVIGLNRDKTWAIVLGIIGSIVSGGVYPAYAVVLGRMLDILGKYALDIPELRDRTAVMAPLFIVLGVAAMVGWCLQAFYGYAGEHLTTRLRVMLMRNILRQDMSFYDTPGRDAGALSALLSGDCEAVHQLYGQSIGFKIQMFCNITTGIIIGFFYQWKLAFVTIACIPVMVLAGALQQAMLVGMGHQTEKAADSIVNESLSNIRTVISFNLGKRRTELYVKSVMDELPTNIRKSIVIGCIYGFSQFTFYGVFALAFWYGGKLVANGETDFEGVMITTMAVLMGAMGAGEAGGFAAKMADAAKSSKKVFAVIDRKPDIDPLDRGDMDLPPGCDIQFEGVQFIYPARPKQVVLKHLTARFADKTSNGLMGQTGCGKSTTIQMLARFYAPKKGTIKVSNKSLPSLDLQTWRENVSIVLQEPNLFSGSIRDNIRYSNQSATDEEVEHAATLACIHNDIMAMPAGYDTDVGYKGRALSGGQKQRVAIARGLLRKPKLLLLDEATSALDNATETKVQHGIDQACRENPMTVVSIAHRLSTIRDCNKILLLDEGEIMEEGNHASLMELNGEYKVRWELFSHSTESH